VVVLLVMAVGGAPGRRHPWVDDSSVRGRPASPARFALAQGASMKPRRVRAHDAFGRMACASVRYSARKAPRRARPAAAGGHRGAPI